MFPEIHISAELYECINVTSRFLIKLYKHTASLAKELISVGTGFHRQSVENIIPAGGLKKLIQSDNIFRVWSDNPEC